MSVRLSGENPLRFQLLRVIYYRFNLNPILQMKPEEKIKYEMKKAEEMGLENYLRTRTTSMKWYWTLAIFAAGFVIGAIIL